MSNRPNNDYSTIIFIFFACLSIIPLLLVLTMAKQHKEKNGYNEAADSTAIDVPVAIDHNDLNNCNLCKGSGYTTVPATCNDCNGRGYKKCNYTFPDLTIYRGNTRTIYLKCLKGRLKCRSCSGSGREGCYNCNGNGYIWGKACVDCHGRGWVSCSICNGTGFIKCTACEGTGRIGCASCNNTGKVMKEITCKECKGTGKKT